MPEHATNPLLLKYTRRQEVLGVTNLSGIYLLLIFVINVLHNVLQIWMVVKLSMP